MTKPAKDARDMSPAEYRAAVRQIVADGHQRRNEEQAQRAFAAIVARLAPKTTPDSQQ
ncbi:hypothetical protein VOI32_15610 [Paraburkholderia caribensis]|uniref:Uncharacterized protein n=1 Tax=Paraburkholderia caribensis TaxID=75105 RepID=A0ABV0DW39_9BURK|nr:hypothetical protein [Paraburkholderia caribensis]MCO4875781.1 hypothetical protein [Paraburkholderia caribensis]